MPGFNLYTGRRLEDLAEKLSEIAVSSGKDPFSPEYIVVQSRGMKKWISLRLAQRLGIWANAVYPFPNEILKKIFTNFFPELPDERFFQKDLMTWKTMKLLREFSEDKRFDLIRDYILTEHNIVNDMKLFQLSARIADLFDQYLTYRPEMIMEWDDGKDDSWQAVLWRSLTEGTDAMHPPALRRKLADLIPSAGAKTFFTDRINIFGISAIPRFHIDVLAMLSKFVEINFFILNPSHMWWGDIRSKRDILKNESREKKTDRKSEHLEEGNPILASNGRSGREFFKYLFTISEDINEIESPETDQVKTVLSIIQDDIYNLIDRGASEDLFSAPVEFSRDEILSDRSLVIASCHSRLREIEALHDYLLSVFDSANQPGLKDIIVMTPEIELYAPYIHAVFGSRKELHNFPYSVLDRRVSLESPTVKTFLSILSIGKKRFGAAEVMDILECPAVLLRFSISDEELDLLKKWVSGSGIRWGVDSAFRSEMGLPAENLNTWEFGIDRMLLGSAMSGGEDFAIKNGIFPYDMIEGAAAELLGRFVMFYDRIKYYHSEIKSRRTVSSWGLLLKSMISDFFSPEASGEKDISLLNSITDRLAGIESASGFVSEIGSGPVSQFISSMLESEYLSGEFLTGGLIFCEMLPMRSVPFDVICMIGMNDSSFPRRESGAGFNLMAQNPMPGDRSLRDEDRYLFLESLICARKKVYISYIGQRMQDNGEIPPSVLVSELEDYIDQSFRITGEKKKASSFITVKHALQPFSSRYFSGEPGLFSYSEENRSAALTFRDVPFSEKKYPPFMEKEITPDIHASRIIRIDEVESFMANPVRFFLAKRLDVYIRETGRFLDENEPFDIDDLSAFLLKQKMLDAVNESEWKERLYQVLKLSGLLPHSGAGKYFFEKNASDVGILKSGIDESEWKELHDIEISISAGNITFTGKINGLFTEGIRIERPGKIRDRASPLLGAWVKHLFINLHKSSDFEKSTRLYAIDKTVEFARFDEADKYIKILSGYISAGLSRPVAFFPESSFAYAKSLLGGKSVDESLKSAISKWENFNFPESADPYFSLAFRGAELFDDNFRTTAIDIFEPMIRLMKKIS